MLQHDVNMYYFTKRLIPPALISFTANLHMTNGKGTYRFPEISFYFRQMLSTMVFHD